MTIAAGRNLSEETKRISMRSTPMKADEGGRTRPPRDRARPLDHLVDQQIAQVVIVRGGTDWVGASAEESTSSNSWMSRSSRSCTSLETIRIPPCDRQMNPEKGYSGTDARCRVTFAL